MINFISLFRLVRGCAVVVRRHLFLYSLFQSISGPSVSRCRIEFVPNSARNGTQTRLIAFSYVRRNDAASHRTDLLFFSVRRVQTKLWTNWKLFVGDGAVVGTVTIHLFQWKIGTIDDDIFLKTLLPFLIVISTHIAIWFDPFYDFVASTNEHAPTIESFLLRDSNRSRRVLHIS